MGILALSNHLNSYLIGRHHPFQLQQMYSCVWRATIHLLYSGDSAQQTVAPSSDSFEARISLSKSLSKKSVLPPCTSHFESPGEDRQATPNRQIFKTGKGTVRIKTFLAKESQPRQVESQWIERAKTAHILPNQNEAALTLTKERVSTLIGKKGVFKKFSVPNLSKRTGREECQLHLVNILLDLYLLPLK
ncbi:hypothetical protein AVEN_99175-1 [Araneus ventricosus]|uniref:Uncharacterized protein n=1 Tax=Araneus ventricosus TaxID=182803 RepID=A0A4Y2CHS9_ARAVE|nr:hypothetical protein AVEN_99175-1 [Araneus ventricosus]